MVSKADLSAVAAELIGTFVLALAVLTMSRSSLNFPFFISLAAGLAVAGAMLQFGRLSGAQINPAVTLGLLSVKRISILRAVAYIVAQLLGGLLAYYLFAYFAGQRWHVAARFETRILIAETIGAFLFSLGWAATVTQKLESGRAAAVIGLSFALALLAVSGAGTVMLNPAVALGLRSWVWGSSVFGPLVGSVVGFQVYRYLFAPEPSPVKEAEPEKPIPKIAGTQARAPKHLR